MAVTAPDCHKLAAEQLTKAGIKFAEIIRVHVDAILYLDENRRPWTAWSEVRPPQVNAGLAKGMVGEKVVFYRQPGFEAFPHAYIKNESE